jgi:hypothetical protein
MVCPHLSVLLEASKMKHLKKIEVMKNHLPIIRIIIKYSFKCCLYMYLLGGENEIY